MYRTSILKSEAIDDDDNTEDQVQSIMHASLILCCSINFPREEEETLIRTLPLPIVGLQAHTPKQ